ncbi:MAG TPA: tRNA (adenosine(37)-N6)-threonylcarbamoyltransferase complex transferase subunit TsaD [Candidatus Moranbacteria bacterium]|nr:tRNA (adenosine(37)-N6)-threonylcarbamoyltransferase complex transferase subunit TsaD [Candidatus Moranbacteria bacterium]
MLIAAIETSCDETSVAVLRGNEKNSSVQILSNIVSSQIKLHAKWGGVVPNLAAREHVKNIIPVLQQALLSAKVQLNQVDLFSVTNGPGLIPALLVGVNTAKTLCYFHQKPLLGIHHVEGHLTGAFFDNYSTCKITPDDLPLLCLTVSGGHTQLIYSKNFLEYEIIGETQDDAAGEAFDKVAKMLEVGYPGGPIVEKLASEYLSEHGHSDTLKLPRPMLKNNNFDFSFSGLKTAVLYQWENQKNSAPEQALVDLKKQFCYEFQQAVTEVLTKKTVAAIQKHKPQTVILAGGVAANQTIRAALQKEISQNIPKTKFLSPPMTLCGDNAAMIGAAAFFRFQKLKKQNKLESLLQNWKNLPTLANASINAKLN